MVEIKTFACPYCNEDQERVIKEQFVRARPYCIDCGGKGVVIRAMPEIMIDPIESVPQPPPNEPE